MQVRSVEGWPLGFLAGSQEPRVRDTDLGERLGYDRPRDVRKLIERMEIAEKLKDVHRCATVARGAAPEVLTEYWLTEAQALKVAAKSETDVADALLDEMIRVFMLARRGLLETRPALSPEVTAKTTRLFTLTAASLCAGQIEDARAYQAAGWTMLRIRAPKPAPLPAGTKRQPRWMPDVRARLLAILAEGERTASEAIRGAHVNNERGQRAIRELVSEGHVSLRQERSKGRMAKNLYSVAPSAADPKEMN